MAKAAIAINQVICKMDLGRGRTIAGFQANRYQSRRTRSVCDLTSRKSQGERPRRPTGYRRDIRTRYTALAFGRGLTLGVQRGKSRVTNVLMGSSHISTEQVVHAFPYSKGEKQSPVMLRADRLTDPRGHYESKQRMETSL